MLDAQRAQQQAAILRRTTQARKISQVNRFQLVPRNKPFPLDPAIVLVKLAAERH